MAGSYPTHSPTDRRSSLSPNGPGARPFAAQPGWNRPTPEGPAALGSSEDYLAAIMALLEQVVARLQARVQQGIVYTITVLVNNNVPQLHPLNPPVFSISLQNDGPGIVQYRIPDTSKGDWVDLRPNEVDQYNVEEPVIRGVAMRVLGANATIRIKLLL